MKQHLKTKMLDDKALRLSASSYQQQITYLFIYLFIYLYVISLCKRNYKKEVILNLKVSYVYCKSFIITTAYFWLVK